MKRKLPSTPDRIKYAAVGAGGMGRSHLREMARPSRSSFANLEPAAIRDLNRENANFLADEAHEFLGERPKVYSDIAQMARENPDLRAADITTDAGSHHTVATACLQAGLHVLCEKLLAAELWNNPRPWTYKIDFNETDSRIPALEYFELAECIRTGATPDVSGEEARADVALVYAPFEAGDSGSRSRWTR